MLALESAALAGNGTYRCHPGGQLTVSGYTGWQGSVKVNYRGNIFVLPNYYKNSFGKSPNSESGFLDISEGGVTFKLGGYTVCTTHPD